ncbi:MAG: hypothetical protein D6763_09210 [Alphaproteobacteria bacterium]|nr:MAG: hypothetical protein D6763_09210 [Alphaproteobacteria bacterium]
MTRRVDLIVRPDPSPPHRGRLRFRRREYPCALGKAGVTTDKREGDLKTPVGRFVLRRVYYRPDRLERPETALPREAITPAHGWCDDPGHALYNRAVHLPFAARHEKLWRDDHVYDLIVVLGYNDDPPVPGRGSAIFLHVARNDFAGTEGCVALARQDLLDILAEVDRDSVIEIRPLGD